jgi:Xaa-Pro aminopeptidase
MLTTGTLWKQSYRSGEINDFRTARFGLIDKADVQNENPDWPAKKNISCTGHRITWD